MSAAQGRAGQGRRGVKRTDGREWRGGEPTASCLAERYTGREQKGPHEQEGGEGRGREGRGGDEWKEKSAEER